MVSWIFICGAIWGDVLLANATKIIYLQCVSFGDDGYPLEGLFVSLFQLWTMPIRDCKAALMRFTISYEDRLPQQ